MQQPWMGLIETGKKPIESRCSQRKVAPYKRVHIGDWIYFRESGTKLVNVKTRVLDVKYYNGSAIFQKMRLYQSEIGIDEAYIQLKKKCVYLTLIWLDHPVFLNSQAFIFEKHDQRSWISNFSLPQTIRSF